MVSRRYVKGRRVDEAIDTFEKIEKFELKIKMKARTFDQDIKYMIGFGVFNI